MFVILHVQLVIKQQQLIVLHAEVERKLSYYSLYKFQTLIIITLNFSK